MMRYEIRVEGRIARDWGDWFKELQLQTPGEEEHLPHELRLTGCLPDQSALLGVLMRLHNLNMTILSVQKFDEEKGRK